MRKLTLIILLLSIVMISKSVAQKGERIQSLRIAIYTEELKLTSLEAQKFWPIFNDYQDKLSQIKKERETKMKSYRGKGELSEKQAEEILNNYYTFKQNQLNLEKEYMNKLKSVLPTKKIIRIPKAEGKFKRALLAQIKERKKP